MTLEEILKKHFGCKKPFLKKPKAYTDGDCGTRYEYMTSHGNRAYSNLVSLIYDLGTLGIGVDADQAIETLDSIVSENVY